MNEYGEPVTTTLVKLSLCPCGHALLRDEIELGAEYTVYPATVIREELFMLLCGGCGGKTVGYGQILANSRHNPAADPTPLPIEIFAINEQFAKWKLETKG